MLGKGKSVFLRVDEHKVIFILREGGLHAGQSYGRNLWTFFHWLWNAFSVLIRDSWKSWKDSLPFQLLVVFEDDNRLFFLNSFFFTWYAFASLNEDI